MRNCSCSSKLLLGFFTLSCAFLASTFPRLFLACCTFLLQFLNVCLLSSTRISAVVFLVLSAIYPAHFVTSQVSFTFVYDRLCSISASPAFTFLKIISVDVVGCNICILQLVPLPATFSDVCILFRVWYIFWIPIVRLLKLIHAPDQTDHADHCYNPRHRFFFISIIHVINPIRDREAVPSNLDLLTLLSLATQ